MSRFHKEFFAEKSIEHDELLLKCLTKDGKQKILDSVIGDHEWWLNHYLKDSLSTWICDCRDQPFCQAKKPKMAWNNPEVERYCQFQDSSLNRLTDLKSCECLTEPQKEDDGYHSIPAPGERVTTNLILEERKFHISNYETEVICKNGNFIIGYADILFESTINDVLSLLIRQDWTWSNYEAYVKHQLIVIEAKPKLAGFGAVLRQIKTYKEIIARKYEDPKFRYDYDQPSRSVYGVVATYSDVSEQIQEVLAKERVHIAQFSKNGEKK